MADLPPAGPVVHRAVFTLSYADCDPAGIVYFATWPVLCERTFTKWAYEQGCDYRRVADDEHAAQVIRHVDADFLSSAVLHDEVTVAVAFEHLGVNSYRTRFTLTNQHGTTLAVLRFTYAFAGPDGTKTAVPPTIRRMAEPHLRDV